MKQKISISFTFFLFASCTLFSQCQVLTWSDEFDGTGSPNSTYWGFDIGAGGWGNGEVQSYTSSATNVRLENGSLVIEAIKSGSSWTSARVKSQNKKSFKYGKIVFRAKLPSGIGTWPALWMLGDNITSAGWPACGEIDIMEHVGRNQGVVQSALHNPSSFGDTQNKASTSVANVTSEFHEYSLSWNSTRMVFAVDDVPFYTYNPATKNSSTWPYDASQFIIMNIAMGGTLGGSIDPSLTSARMEIDYVRVYEERTNPIVYGPSFLLENQQNVSYSAPDYGSGITYSWTVPADATIVSGQGTKQIVVNWGILNGAITLDLTGNTGCSINSTALTIATIAEPTGIKYTIEDFSNPSLSGWSKNDNGINYQVNSNRLNVSYNITALKYIQYSFPKAVHLSNYGILKLPVQIPKTSNTPTLILTLLDGNGNETITTNFEIKPNANDDTFYTYTYNFDGQWNLNNPAVNDIAIKSLKIYMLSGQASFSLGAIEMYASKQLPTPPNNLSYTTSAQGSVALGWIDQTNAITFNLYKSSSISGTYTKVKSLIKTSENPYNFMPTEAQAFYKLSSVNTIGESPLSNPLEVVSAITEVSGYLHENTFAFPNPNNGHFSIKAEANTLSEMKIIDSKGSSVPFNSEYINSLCIIDLKTYNTGLHVIYFKIDGVMNHLKVLIK